MADILKQLGIDTIPAVRTFCAEPAPSLTCVPVEQRVREFLASTGGTAWLNAAIESYASYQFTLHLAYIHGSIYPQIVVEDDAGNLSHAVPLPPEYIDPAFES